MPEASDPNRKKPSPPEAPDPPGDEAGAYELEEKSEPEKKPKGKGLAARSYLMDDETPELPPEARAAAAAAAAEDDRLLRAKKMLGMGESGRPAEVKPVKPGDMARKREEARRKAAEEWAAQDAARLKKRLIIAGVLLIIVAVVFFVVRSKLG